MIIYTLVLNNFMMMVMIIDTHVLKNYMTMMMIMIRIIDPPVLDNHMVMMINKPVHDDYMRNYHYDGGD